MSLMQKLMRPIPSEQIGLFRIGFGLFMFIEFCYFLWVGYVPAFSGVKFNLGYVFGPQGPHSEGLMYFLIALGMIASVLLIIGFRTRIMAGALFVSFSTLFLLDKSIYNNHLYLFCLLALILTIIPESNGLRFVGRKPGRDKIPIWSLWLLQFQLVVVYFFGGIAKLNSDWLIAKEPGSTILAYKAAKTGADWITSDWLLTMLTYGGLVFDLSIGFLLLWRKTRLFAIAGVLFFNFTNHWLFDDINVFPFFMLFATILFLDPEWFKRFGLKEKVLKRGGKKTKTTETSPAMKSYVMIGLVIYVAVQLIMPLRHFFISGHADWTGEGQRFAWRMKVFTKDVEELQFAIFDMRARKIYEVNLSNYLNEEQIRQMPFDPQMIWCFAGQLAEDEALTYNRTDVEIKAKVKVSMNGRPAAYLFDPETPLNKVEWKTTRHNSWLAELPEHE